jgi:hypothetical protein
VTTQREAGELHVVLLVLFPQSKIKVENYRGRERERERERKR